MIGVWPPADRPAAIENASPSRLTGTSRSDGSACMSWYKKFVSLSGSHTTCVTPFFVISARTTSGLSWPSAVSGMISGLHGRASCAAKRPQLRAHRCIVPHSARLPLPEPEELLYCEQTLRTGRWDFPDERSRVATVEHEASVQAAATGRHRLHDL